VKLIERNVATVERRLVLIAPAAVRDFPAFRDVVVARDLRARLVHDIQRMRGAIYLEDGAIDRHQLSRDGLHMTPEDDRSWHLLFMNREQEVTACVWLVQHDINASFEDLRVRNCPLAHQADWRDKLKDAVESELSRARQEGLRYAEVGGWAVAKQSRCTSEGLLLALAAYSLGRRFGGALGITTATVRHSSSTMLRRLGGSDLRSGTETIPSYYDPGYQCRMELLRFDSRRPSAKYASLIEKLRKGLAYVPVVAEGSLGAGLARAAVSV
jgi:hypothetical protein